MLPEQPESTYTLDGEPFQFLKAGRRLAGIVLRSETGTHFARLGPPKLIQMEQSHVRFLHTRGFPVPEVVSSGRHGTNECYFIEESVGDRTFHDQFMGDMERCGGVQPATFQAYMDVMRRYIAVQMKSENRTNVRADEFVSASIPEPLVVEALARFKHDVSAYREAIRLATIRLNSSPMGWLQYDLNPFNVLDEGVVDFELVGPGPLGYDTLLSARWAGTWYTDYPSRYPTAYRLSAEQIAESDSAVDEAARLQGIVSPTEFLEEFLLLRSAYGLAYFDAHDPRPYTDWPLDRRYFQSFRSNVLAVAVAHYVRQEPIPVWTFPTIRGDASV